jgi:hypothetical protein
MGAGYVTWTASSLEKDFTDAPIKVSNGPVESFR